MEKSVLEKRIEGKAEERFREEMKKIRFFLKDNPITQKLEFNSKDKSKVTLIGDNSNTIFSTYPNVDQDYLKENSNFKEIKKELIEKYIKEETDTVLSKLDNLNYLFNQ